MIYFMIVWCITHALWAAAVMRVLERGVALTNKEMLLGAIMCPFLVIPLVTVAMTVYAFEDTKKLIKRFKEER